VVEDWFAYCWGRVVRAGAVRGEFVGSFHM